MLRANRQFLPGLVWHLTHCRHQRSRVVRSGIENGKGSGKFPYYGCRHHGQQAYPTLKEKIRCTGK